MQNMQTLFCKVLKNPIMSFIFIGNYFPESYVTEKCNKFNARKCWM